MNGEPLKATTTDPELKECLQAVLESLQASSLRLGRLDAILQSHSSSLLPCCSSAMDIGDTHLSTVLVRGFYEEAIEGGVTARRPATLESQMASLNALLTKHGIEYLKHGVDIHLEAAPV